MRRFLKRIREFVFDKVLGRGRGKPKKPLPPQSKRSKPSPLVKFEAEIYE